MKCYFCKGSLENGFTSHVSEIGESVIFIKNIPCLKCDQCGEVSYIGSVYERIEQIVDSLRSSVTEAAIVKYSDSAA